MNSSKSDPPNLQNSKSVAPSILSLDYRNGNASVPPENRSFAPFSPLAKCQPRRNLSISPNLVQEAQEEEWEDQERESE